jgi:hypothetical protein
VLHSSWQNSSIDANFLPTLQLAVSDNLGQQTRTNFLRPQILHQRWTRILSTDMQFYNHWQASIIPRHSSQLFDAFIWFLCCRPFRSVVLTAFKGMCSWHNLFSVHLFQYFEDFDSFLTKLQQKMPYWIFVANIKHPFSWHATQTLLQLKYNSSTLNEAYQDKFANMYLQLAALVGHWITPVSQCCQSCYLIVRPQLHMCKELAIGSRKEASMDGDELLFNSQNWKYVTSTPAASYFREIKVKVHTVGPKL